MGEQVLLFPIPEASDKAHGPAASPDDADGPVEATLPPTRQEHPAPAEPEPAPSGAFRGEEGLDVLNEPQRRAAAHIDGPLLIFAGAGSGKTRVITYRVANLIVHDVPAYRILAVTFTNKAAQEMRKRLEGLIGPSIAKDLWVGTFHAVCARLLRRYTAEAGLASGFVVYDDADQRAVMNRVLKELRLDDKRYPPRQLLSRIHKEKQEGRGPDDFEATDYMGDIVHKCFVAYQAQLKAANAVDFDDLIVEVMRLAEADEGRAAQELRRRFRYVLVDEFQDVNSVQYRLVRALSREHENLCVVGDDDQSIYRWRGADVRIVRGFRRDLPRAEIVKLEQNYRSTGHIVAAALGVIKPSREREAKELWTDNEPGPPIRVVATDSERDEAAWVVGKIAEAIETGTDADEIAVFYRVHAQSRVLEEVLRSARIPYQVVGGTRFFDRAEIKDLTSYLRVLANPRSDVDLLRIINTPSRKIGDATIERLVAAADAAGSCLYDAIEPLVKSKGVGPQPRKNLTAFHEMMEKLRETAKTAPPSELAEAVLDDSGYRAMLRRDERPENEARLQNLEELFGAIREFEDDVAAEAGVATLDAWLERVTLSSSVDDMDDGPKVALMTVHAAKGLEFDAVFITGMEEDLFPFRSSDPNRQGDDEEERRLAYVAITRARRHLAITHAQRRQIFGNTRYGRASRFVHDLPAEVVVHEKTELAQMGSGRFIDREADVSFSRGDDWVHPQQAASNRMGRAAQTRVPLPRPAGPPRAPGERFVERDPSMDQSDGGELGVGTHVRHKTFGTGVVAALDGGPDPTATVHFVGWPPKRIKVRFLMPG